MVSQIAHRRSGMSFISSIPGSWSVMDFNIKKFAIKFNDDFDILISIQKLDEIIDYVGGVLLE